MAAPAAARPTRSTRRAGPRGRRRESNSWKKIRPRRASSATPRCRPSRRARGTAAARASMTVTPASGRFAAIAMARAAASPTRTPVKLPGPTVTAMRSSPAQARPLAAMVSRTMGTRRSACPRAIASPRPASTRPASTTATEQPARQQSKARSRMPWRSPARHADGTSASRAARTVLSSRLGCRRTVSRHVRPEARSKDAFLDAFTMPISLPDAAGRRDCGARAALDRRVGARLLPALHVIGADRGRGHRRARSS